MDILHAQLAAIQRKLAFVQEDPIDWQTYVLFFSWGICLFESYLLLRQYPLYSKTTPPAVLADHFKPEVFENCQKYGKHKAKFSIVSGLYKQVIDTAQLASGLYYPWAWKASGQLLGLAGYGPEYLISQSVVFVFVLTFTSTLPTLPLGLYQTFVLEEQHGFNKTTLSLYFADMLKGWALGIVLGTPLLSAFLYVFEWAGDRFVPWVMMLLLVFQLLMIILYPTVIQPLFNKLSPLPEGELRTRIEALASKLKFPLKHLYEIDGSKRSSHSNAYFFGLPWSKHIVIFDTLIKQSQAEEVEAVLAHELGHWYYLHPTKLLVVSQLHLFTILALFPAFLHAPPFLRSFGFPESVATRPPPIIAYNLTPMLLTPFEAVVGMALNAISRRFEYQADRFACELPAIIHVESAEDKEEMKDMGTRLGRALISLHVENLATVWVDWLYSAYHHSHPTLTERLKALGEHGHEGLGTAESKKKQ
ncbi:metalloendopeptidase [Russula brevipes]|nr:metalloendopeptidase [Russula brevipes]